jgi:hypothetical protein
LASSKNRSKGRSGGGRVTPPSSGRRSTGGSSRNGASTKGGSASRASQPGIDVKAVDRLVARADLVVVGGRVRSAFSGTGPLSPNLATVLGAVPAVAIVAVSVSLKQPILLLVALAVMAAVIVLLMWGVNSTWVVAELPRELVAMTNRRGELEPRFRVPPPVEVQPYLDRRWVKVLVGGQRLWVSRRTYGGVVDVLAGTRDEVDEP